MTKSQWTVLFIGGMLMLLSEVFPPWVYEDGWTSAQRTAGYHFLTKPPAVKSQNEMKRIFGRPVEEIIPSQSIGIALAYLAKGLSC